MAIDFDGICNEMFGKGIVIAAVVCKDNGSILYMSSNWSVEPNDLAQCIKKWRSRSQFVTLQDRKYSILFNSEEYFTGINFKDRDFIIGASSPDPSNPLYVVAYAPPGVDGRNAYVDVVRAANRMREGSSSYQKDDGSASANLKQATTSTATVSAASSSGNSVNRQEVQQFLDWIKNQEGLGAYIQYYLNQNDQTVIAKLSKAYRDLLHVFGY